MRTWDVHFKVTGDLHDIDMGHLSVMERSGYEVLDGPTLEVMPGKGPVHVYTVGRD